MARQDKPCKSGNCFESFLVQHRNRRESARKAGQQARTASKFPDNGDNKCIKCILFSCNKLRD